MPIFWTPEELAYLEGSYLLQQIEERKVSRRRRRRKKKRVKELGRLGD